MPSQAEIYQHHAEIYDRLIQREDAAGNLPRAIDTILSVNGLDVVDLGAGTGRLARLLGPRVRSLMAFDASGRMLAVAAESLREMGLSNWQTDVADHRQLPLLDASVDLVVSGWSFAYLWVWGDRFQLDAGLAEVMRVLRPSGTVIFIESLGTGQREPIRLEHLDGYYDWLDEQGFAHMEISTDYRFASLDEARELIGFFFGEEMARGVGDIYSDELPEFTGLWWRTKD